MSAPSAGASPSQASLGLHASFADEGEGPVPNASLAMGAGAPMFCGDGVVLSGGGYGSGCGGDGADEGSVPNTSVVSAMVSAAGYGGGNGGVLPAPQLSRRGTRDSFSSSDQQPLMTPNNSIVGALTPVPAPHLSIIRRSSLGGGSSTTSTPLLVPNNSIVADIRNVAGPSPVEIGAGGCAFGAASSTPVPVGVSGPNNASEGASDEFRQSALYACFAAPPHCSAETAAVERCFSLFAPSAARPAVIQWRNVAALLREREAAAFGARYDATATLTLEKFMDFVDDVAKKLFVPA